MKKIIILVSLLFTSFTSNAQIVLNEIYVRPDGAVPTPPNGIIYSGSKEYIELYNKGCTTINVSGYFLATKQQGLGGAGIVTGLTIRIPNVPAAIIPPGGHVVLGPAIPGGGLVGIIDIPLSSSDWCLYANNAVISNVESWLALYNNLGVALDCVYWSNAPGNITANPNDFNPGTLCLPTGSPAVTLQTPTQINASNPSIISYIANSTPILIYRQQDGSSTWSFVSTYDAATLPWTMGNCNGGNCLPNATITGISYASPFYTFETSPQPVTLTGTGSYTGGTYSSTTGLSINVSTGAITPSASNAGTYTVTYTKTLSGVCIVTASTQVTIFGPSTPVSVTVPPYINCDSNNGFSVFDLTINNSIILAGQPASTSNYFITYHETLINANNGTNPLVPENYYNIIPYNQTIYYRVVDPVTGEFAVGSIQLIVNDAPVAVVLNPIVVCDQDSNPQNGGTTIDLTVQTPYIIGSLNPANYTVTYYTSNADAIAGINPIVNANNYQGYSFQTIWYRIQDNAITCYGINSFQLIVNTPLILTTPAPFSVCDNDANPNNLFTTFDLTLIDTQINQGTGYTITYYPSSPITSSSIAITNPTSYTNTIQAVQTLGVRVISPQGCYSDTTLDIRVLPIPTPNTNPIPLAPKCDNNNPGDMLEVFDLTVNESYIRNGDPNVTFHYFPTQADATANINEIPIPTAALAGGNIVWIRLENNRVDIYGNNCYVLVEQPLTVNPLPTIAQPLAPYILYDNGNDGYESFNLSSQNNNILGVQSEADFTITFYPSITNAQNNNTPIINPTNYTNTVIYNQTLGIRVTNNTTGCYNISSMDIGVIYTLGLSDTEIVPLQFAPNPVKNNLELQSTIVLQSVIIYNVLGQKVYEKIINDTSTILDLSNLRTGNYLVKIDAETGQKVIRIVKE